MSMLTGATLAVSLLLGADPVTAEASPTEAASHAASPSPVATTTAVAPPAEFGTDWHDPPPRRPPVGRPGTRSCQVTLAEAQVRDFTAVPGHLHPAARLWRPLGQGRAAP
jgi:hypothetical protein